MRYILTLFLFTVFSFMGNAQNYLPQDSKSSVNFFIKNVGINVKGDFKGLQGLIHFKESDLASSLFDVFVDATTINTGINARDNHLKKADYFDVQKFGTIRFTSSLIVNSGTPDFYTITGTILIKGKKKEISFPFTISPVKEGMLFAGSFTLNRRDFSVGGSNLFLSDDVKVTLSIFAKKIIP